MENEFFKSCKIFAKNVVFEIIFIVSLKIYKKKIFHQIHCPRRYPPGNEIYRDTGEQWNIWEVEGSYEKVQ